MMRDLVLVEAPCNLGLIEPSPGVEPGVRFLPQALRETGLARALGCTYRLEVPSLPYTMQIDAASGIRNADALAVYSRRLAQTIRGLVEQGRVPLVIGGDCSILLGIGLGLKMLNRYGLFFLDGHTDYQGPDQSETAGAAGMDLALVTGNGPEKLTDIDQNGPYFKEEDVFCVGNRDLQPDYVSLIHQSKINYVDLAALRERGSTSVTKAFLQHVATEDLTGFWIHLDADVFDDFLLPCVDSRQPGGLAYEEMRQLLAPLLQSPRFCGINVTILDPTLDAQKTVVPEFPRNLARILSPLTVEE